MRYGRTGPRRSRRQELNGTVEPSRRSPDGHRASGIRHRLLGAGVTIPADYPPVVLLTAALSRYLMLWAAVSAILLALARHWILTIVAFGLTATALAVQAPLYRVPTAAEREVSSSASSQRISVKGKPIPVFS